MASRERADEASEIENICFETVTLESRLYGLKGVK